MRKAGRRKGLLIAGGGVAGSLLALAIARRRPDFPLLLVEEKETLGGPSALHFFEREIGEDERWLLAPLIGKSWEGYYLLLPGQNRNIRSAIHLIPAGRIDRVLRQVLQPGQIRTGARIVAVREDELVLTGGESIRADAAVDARGAANLTMLENGWHRIARSIFRMAAPHQLDRPVLVDSTVEQKNGFRFFRSLPLGPDRLILDEAELSADPVLGASASTERQVAYARSRGWKVAELEEESSAALPLPIAADFPAFWRVGGARVAKIGMRGGFIHPSTGYGLADAVRVATLVSRSLPVEGAALHDLVEAEAAALWRRRQPMRDHNRRLFAGGGIAELANAFFAQEPAFLARFHADALGVADRRKLARIGR